MKNPWFKSKPLEERTPFWWLRWVPTVIMSVLILYFLYVVGSVAIVPVLASFALAYLLNPIVYQAEKYGLSRTMSSIVAILLVTLVITAFMAYVVPDLWAESTKAGSRIAENFTPENAARQRAVLRRYSPALEAVAGDKIEQFLSDPAKFYNENMTSATTTTVDEDSAIRWPFQVARIIARSNPGLRQGRPIHPDGTGSRRCVNLRGATPQRSSCPGSPHLGSAQCPW